MHPTAFGQLAIAERALELLAGAGLEMRVRPSRLVAPDEPTGVRRLRGDVTYAYRHAKVSIHAAALRAQATNLAGYLDTHPEVEPADVGHTLLGSRALLERHGIPVVHDAPQVGEGLQDHFYVRTFWRCCKDITLNDDMMSLWRQARMGLKYLLFKQGPLTISAGAAWRF